MANHYHSQTKSGISYENFKKEIDGKIIKLFVLSNKNGFEVTFTNFGARIISLMIPKKDGTLIDVVLGHRTINEYISPKNEYYFGAIIGRYANRIKNGRFVIDDQEYVVEQNNGKNHLHGGAKGFHRRVWDANQISENEIEFSYFSKDLEEGYPGNLQVVVKYILNDFNELEIIYTATSDKTTILNLTNHSYFNLAGEGKSIVNNHILTINADHFTSINKDQIPNGRLDLVDNMPFDFRNPKIIGRDIDRKNAQLEYGNGYDHNFVLNSMPVNQEGLVLAARVKELKSEITMELYTSEPGVQLYTANFLDGTSKGKNGTLHKMRTGFCLETQHFPNSPNQPDFPNVILEKGNEYWSKSVYKFYSSSK